MAKVMGARRFLALGGLLVLGLSFLLICPHSLASHWDQTECAAPCQGGFVHDGCGEGGAFLESLGGTWYWMRSPEQEKVILSSYFNRYCVRCHGIDGRGVWDMPGIPDFTNARWQAYRSDAQIARIIIEGRGAVMPAFRGTLTLEEAWAMARYLRSFAPGSEVARPELSTPENEKVKSPKADRQSFKK